MTQTTLETWEMKAKRLALELKAARPVNESPSSKQRFRHFLARYELQQHIDAVTEDA